MFCKSFGLVIPKIANYTKIPIAKLIHERDVTGFYLIDIDWQVAFEIC